MEPGGKGRDLTGRGGILKRSAQTGGAYCRGGAKGKFFSGAGLNVKGQWAA